MAKVRQTRSASRTRGPDVDESANYLFEIVSFAPSYSFGAGSSFQETAHDEYLAAKISATCLGPDKYGGRVTIFTLLGSRDHERLMKEQSSPYKAAMIGRLTLRGRESEFLGSLPFDTLVHLQSLLTASKFKYIWLTGAKISRGSATISRISFDIDIEEADLHLLSLP